MSTEDNLDIRLAAKVLDEDHYDLADVKERILEFLSVKKLKKSMKGSILCFIGPPGVGKTSLGKSIARAMGRKFVRISLGGMRDEAEIRGHRRTYIGALPGRIIQGMRTAPELATPCSCSTRSTSSGSDFRGDPASALLEVLDPAQNNSFEDHYLNIPYDLSKVLFITTANLLDTIPRPLLDRMEVLELPGYITLEKIEIAKRYLIPRQIEENGIPAKALQISDAGLRHIVNSYTREAGVRELERKIATICRKHGETLRLGKETARAGDGGEREEVPRARGIQRRDRAQAPDGGRGDGAGEDDVGRRDPLHRGAEDAGTRRDEAHGTARRRDEGERRGRGEFRPRSLSARRRP